MRGIAERLANDGFTVDLPLLPGHGTSLDDMLETRWSDWSGAAEEAYRDLAARCEKVVVVGLSMGGTLCCWLAERNPEISGLVVINPMVLPVPEYRAMLQTTLDSGTTVIDAIGSDIAMPDVKEISYKGTPVAPLISFLDGLEEIAERLSEIRCPVLLLSSRVDHVVPVSSGDLLEEAVSGPCERIWLERSYHVATLDYDRDEVELRTVDFVTTAVASPGA